MAFFNFWKKNDDKFGIYPNMSFKEFTEQVKTLYSNVEIDEVIRINDLDIELIYDNQTISIRYIANASTEENETSDIDWIKFCNEKNLESLIKNYIVTKDSIRLLIIEHSISLYNSIKLSDFNMMLLAFSDLSHKNIRAAIQRFNLGDE